MADIHPPLSVPAGTLSPRFIRGLLFFIFLIPCCPGVRAQSPRQGEVAASTAPALPPPADGQSNLMLNLSRTSNYSRVGLDYSIRWDFSDLASFRTGFKTISSELKAISSWNVTKNTRLNYYGFKTNPWKIILADDMRDSGSVAPGAAGNTGSGVVNRAPSASRERVRLSLSPLVDDFKLNLEENLRELFLRGSLNSFSPQWGKAGDEGRREFVKDVLSLGIWDVPVPGVKEGRGGLEYLVDMPAPKAGDKPDKSADYLPVYKINSSTGPLVP